MPQVPGWFPPCPSGTSQHQLLVFCWVKVIIVTIPEKTLATGAQGKLSLRRVLSSWWTPIAAGGFLFDLHSGRNVVDFSFYSFTGAQQAPEAHVLINRWMGAELLSLQRHEMKIMPLLEDWLEFAPSQMQVAWDMDALPIHMVTGLWILSALKPVCQSRHC